MTFAELPQEERQEITERVQTIIGKKENVTHEGMNLSQRVNARAKYDKLFWSLVHVYMEHGAKALAMQFMDYGGIKKGVTPNGKRWELYMNSFGWTDRCRHCGTLYLDGKCIFTSGTLARAFDYILNS